MYRGVRGDRTAFGSRPAFLLCCVLLSWTFALAIGGISHGTAAAAESEPRVMVQRIHFVGHSVFSDEALQAVVAGDLGRPLTLAELRALAARVTRHYHDQGYFLAQVVIPEQEIAPDVAVVTFRVLEGRLGQIVLRGDEAYGERYVRPALSQIKPGEPIHRQTIERALLILNQASGVSVTSVFQAGTETGTTNVYVDVKTERTFETVIDGNNFGVKTSGAFRLAPKFSIQNLSGRGDSVALNLSISPGTAGTNHRQVSYSMPVTARGTHFRGFLSSGGFAVGQEFSSLDIEGGSFSGGFGFTHPGPLTPELAVTYEAWFESTNSNQSMLGVLTSEDKIRKLRLGVSSETRDDRGRWMFGTSLHRGIGELFGAMPNNSTLSSRAFAEADNRFTKLSFNLSRLHRIDQRTFFIGRISGQTSVDPLVAGEQWTIGGANSVRGHEESRHVGDDGVSASLETRYSLGTAGPTSAQLVVFTDYGMVRTKRPTLGSEPTHRLSGAGIGVRVNVVDGFDIRFDLGFPLGEHAGNGPHFYAQSTYRF